MANRESSKKKSKEVGQLKIIKERNKKYVELDVEMDGNLPNLLVKYAEKNMDEEEKRELLINWAFGDILERQIASERLSG